MDDSLETPTALPQAPLGENPPDENDAQSSDEEEGGLDWTKLLPASARPVIPRRGEKEFEPRAGGGTNLQLHVLDRSRSAMFDTLRATRTISSKAVSYATWYPDISRTHVTVARGIHFSSMGHSAPREVVGEDGIEKIQKRLELLPEEAIYLIERGSLFCWKQTDLHLGQTPGLDDVAGSPMTVQQAFSEMIGKEDLTLEKFQVYAYLKRLGYVVTRADPPDDYYPLPPSLSIAKPITTIIQRIKSFFPLWTSLVLRTILRTFNWWQPVGISCWFHHDKNYASLFHSMRFMPAGHSIPLKTSKSVQRARMTTPYRIFFNVYKPSTPFKKSAPPPPDFQLVVINARTTPMPSLQELTDLFDILPEAPLPAPRQKRPQSTIGSELPVAPQVQMPSTKIGESSGSDKSFIRRTFPWFFPSSPSTLASSTPVRRPNPFVALKTGKKIVIVAAVDSGNTSFFRFGQGEFTEWPMVG
ncbi:tRNA-splicing endonuclease subunit sen54 N-term-domain-containing protein [Pholiota molesta]|nr:tRNA-splicing endonuclease subunit sen54 N-term-domain-containing protein [Pholiota molesta]